MANQAPGPLGLVQDFVNTLVLDDPDTEQIGTPEELGAWLGERGLLSQGQVDAAGHALALELREAIRGLLSVNAGRAPRDADLVLLNRVAAASRLRPRFAATGTVVLEPAAPGLPGALGTVLAAAAAAMRDGTWGRLKACADDSCRFAFYDRSKNRSGHWCSMQGCGNRAKAREFRQRRRVRSRPA